MLQQNNFERDIHLSQQLKTCIKYLSGCNNSSSSAYRQNKEEIYKTLLAAFNFLEGTPKNQLKSVINDYPELGQLLTLAVKYKINIIGQDIYKLLLKCICWFHQDNITCILEARTAEWVNKLLHKILAFKATSTHSNDGLEMDSFEIEQDILDKTVFRSIQWFLSSGKKVNENVILKLINYATTSMQGTELNIPLITTIASMIIPFQEIETEPKNSFLRALCYNAKMEKEILNLPIDMLKNLICHYRPFFEIMLLNLLTEFIATNCETTPSRNNHREILMIEVISNNQELFTYTFQMLHSVFVESGYKMEVAKFSQHLLAFIKKNVLLCSLYPKHLQPLVMLMDIEGIKLTSDQLNEHIMMICEQIQFLLRNNCINVHEVLLLFYHFPEWLQLFTKYSTECQGMFMLIIAEISPYQPIQTLLQLII